MEKKEKAIIVLFDYQMFNLQKYGGISRYFANTFYKVKKSLKVSCKLGLLFSNNHYIKNERFPLNNFFFRWLFNKESRIKKWNKVYCKYLLKRNNFDVFHPTYFNPYFLKYLKKPLVITIHDMTYEALPEYFSNADPLTFQKRFLAHKADKIIAISQNTKNDIIRYFNINENKIEVIHHGIDLKMPVNTKIVENIPEEFLLYVGDRNGYKNFYRYLSLCYKLKEIFPKLNFVFVGGGAFKVAEKERLRSHNLTDYCTQINASDEQLNYLYTKARLFVFPSLYEGFGLPILEAFKVGCPIASSNNSCFKEIGGNAIAYFDPYNVSDIYDVVFSVLKNSSRRKELINNGFDRINFFPLEKQISETIELYKSLC